MSRLSLEWRRRSCPSCSSEAISDTPEVRSSKPAESLSWEQVKESFVGLRSEQLFFSYYRCVDCGLLYCPWYFSADQLSALYAEMPDNLMGEDKSVVSRTQSGYVSWIEQKEIASHPYRAYLEIGPDIGLVSTWVDRKFEIQRAYLIEPNRAVHGELRSSMPRVSSIEVSEYLSESSANEVDLIVGVHVYDHLLNPLEELQKLHKIAMAGAHLVIVVHDESSSLRRLMGKKWPPFCLQHPQLFRPETLKSLLAKSGWMMLEVSKTTNWYKLRHFAGMGLGVIGLPSAPAKLLPNISIPLQLGNTISVSAKK